MSNGGIKIGILLCSWFILHMLCIGYEAYTIPQQQADVAVVLGNTVKKNGEVSKRLQARLDRTITLYQHALCHAIIVSGARGIEGHNEALVMRNYLLEQNIPPKAIHTDTVGYNTMQTAQNTYALMQQYRWERVIVVSQFYHLSRCKLAFNKVGIKHIQSACAYYLEWRDIYALFREFFAYYYYLYAY